MFSRSSIYPLPRHEGFSAHISGDHDHASSALIIKKTNWVE